MSKKILPLADYKNKDQPNLPIEYDRSSVAWASCMDGRYGIEVHRVEGEAYAGRYRIFDFNKKNKLILDELVNVACAAPMRADFGDIQAWQDKAVLFIDNAYLP